MPITFSRRQIGGRTLEKTMTNHDLALQALDEPHRSKLTAGEIESIAAFAALTAANEPPSSHERAMVAQARAVLGISLSPMVPVWQR